MNSLNITMRSLDDESELLPSRTSYQSLEIEAKMRKESSYYNDMVKNKIRSNYYVRIPCTPSTSKNGNGIIYCVDSLPTAKKRKMGLSQSKPFQMSDGHRQEMCQWSFRIVDHFGGNRELVSIALNYLDRLLNNFDCEMSQYKLAFITCLSLAIKVHNHKPLSMKSLSTLSAGEFTAQDIVRMESLILKTLHWNLCPPTASSFCHHFYFLLPPVIKETVKKTVLERSCFYCELSLVQGNLVVLKPSQVAFAAMLNAMNDVCPDGSVISLHAKQRFLQDVELHTGMKQDLKSIEFARQEMISLYKRSKQYFLFKSRSSNNTA